VEYIGSSLGRVLSGYPLLYKFNFVFLIAASIIGFAIFLFFIIRVRGYKEKEVGGWIA